MKKRFIFVLALNVIAFTSSLISDPQYYNYNNGTTYNSFPLNITGGKCIQTYIAPGEFNSPSPAPYGNITKYSIRISSGNPLGPVTYDNFRIIFIDTTITGNNMSDGWYTSLRADTVFRRSTYGPINAPAGTWLDFILDHPYYYYASKGLIVQIEQQSATGTFTGSSLQHSITPTYRRHYSIGGSPYVYSGRSQFAVNCGIDVSYISNLPTYMHFKFDYNQTSTMVWNCAIPGVGLMNAPLGYGTPLSSGGQFDSCISGSGLTNGGITTGWACNLGTSSWTISMWINIPSTSSGSAYYFFGDAGSSSFRCFHNGVALQDNLILRGSFTDVTVTGIGPAPTVVTFVYDSAAATLKAYKNGVIAVTSNQTLNIPTGTGFKAGGYGTSPSFIGKMDEFRLYHRALSASEVLQTYNQNLFCDPGGGILKNHNEVPIAYELKQNYPNPFNPITTISFGIPKTGFTKLAVYDILGREVHILVSSILKAGNYKADFSVNNLASGAYFYTLTSGNFIETKKMVIVK